jgi:hypothetical protein
VNALGCGLVILLLSNCTKPLPQQIQVSAKPIEKPQLVLPQADVLNMRDVEWIIVTPENYQEVFDKIKASGRPIALFAMTDKGYENLGLNLSDLRAYVQQQNIIIAAYKEYYTQSEAAIQGYNDTVTQK